MEGSLQLRGTGDSRCSNGKIIALRESEEVLVEKKRPLFMRLKVRRSYLPLEFVDGAKWELEF